MAVWKSKFEKNEEFTFVCQLAIFLKNVSSKCYIQTCKAHENPCKASDICEKKSLTIIIYTYLPRGKKCVAHNDYAWKIIVRSHQKQMTEKTE